MLLFVCIAINDKSFMNWKCLSCKTLIYGEGGEAIDVSGDEL